MGRRLFKGCLLYLAVSMISGAAAIGQNTVDSEKPDTHAMATYIKRLMKRDGQEDWADEVLDWDKRNTFDLKRLMKRDSILEDSNEQGSPMKRDYDNTKGFAPQRLMKKDFEGFAPQRLMKKDLQGFPPKRLMKKDLDSFGPRRLMKKDVYDQSGFSARRLMKRQSEDSDEFDLQRLTKKDFDPKRLMKKELWSTRLIRKESERPMPVSWRVIDLPSNSEVWEPIADVHEPTQGHNWRIEW